MSPAPQCFREHRLFLLNLIETRCQRMEDKTWLFSFSDTMNYAFVFNYQLQLVTQSICYQSANPGSSSIDGAFMFYLVLIEHSPWHNGTGNMRRQCSLDGIELILSQCQTFCPPISLRPTYLVPQFVFCHSVFTRVNLKRQFYLK